MTKNTSKKHAIALATLAAICTMAGLARAEDGGAEDYMIPAALVVNEGDNGGATLSCGEIREAAWFIRELERTDGDVAPRGEEPYCKPDLFAESTADVD